MADLWKTYTLTSGALTLACLPGIGGRLWDVRLGGQSLLFQNPDLLGAVVDPDRLQDLPTRSPQFGFPLWGGEKTWIAPDSDWPNGAPFPALDSGAYKVLHADTSQIGLLSPLCPTSHLQIKRQITLTDAHRFSILHEVTNLGPQERYTGIWSVLMLTHPTQIGLITDPDARIAPVFGDAAGMMSRSGTNVVFDCCKAQEFKSGLHAPIGRVVMRVTTGQDAVFLTCSTPPPQPGQSFAHGQNFEVFNSGDYAYCEAEWHSPAQQLKPRESLIFQQDFTVQSQSELLADHTISPRNKELLSCMC